MAASAARDDDNENCEYLAGHRIRAGRCPANNAENAMKFRFAAFRINSIDMKMTMMLRRVSTPATPMMKSIAAITRNFEEIRMLHALQGQETRASDVSLQEQIQRWRNEMIHRSALVSNPAAFTTSGSASSAAISCFQGARQHHEPMIATARASLRNFERQRSVRVQTISDRARFWFPSRLTPVALGGSACSLVSLPAAALF